MTQDEADFEATSEGVSSARMWVRSHVRSRGVASGDAELVVTELCANVVRHTDDATMNVELSVSEEVLVAVRDGLSADLRAKAAEGDAESGRGLLIVEALATRWGVNRTSDGKRVWATLSQEAC